MVFEQPGPRRDRGLGRAVPGTPRSGPLSPIGLAVSHLDLDLLFSRAEGGYQALVTRSPAGEGQSAIFDRPFSDLELENFVLKVGMFRAARKRRIDSRPVAAAKEAGEKLFDAVFAGAVGECLRRSLDRAEQEQAALRIRLQLSACPELSSMPWELLYDRNEDWFLALSGRTPVIRYAQLPFLPRGVRATPPLRILVIKSEPSDCEPLDLATEWAQVAEALSDLIDYGFVSFTELAVPTLSELRRVLLRNTFHILHYMGHGSFDPRTGGTLLFTDRAGLSQPVTADDLGVMLRDHTSMRLAVLNACEAGRTDATDPFAGVADTLVRRGIPAVVAMQFEVTDRAAVEFAPALYGALAAGLPVDTAVAEARKAMRAVSALEWVTPVLYLRADDAQLFDITRDTLPPDDAAIAAAELDDPGRGPQQEAAAEPAYRLEHYDSGDVRQADTRHVSRAKPETSESILTVGLVGPSASGKTVLMRVLVKHLREAAAQRFGADVRFATVTPGGHPGSSAYQASEEEPLYAYGILPATTSRLGMAERKREIPVVLRWQQEIARPSGTSVLRTALMSFNDTAGEDLVDMVSVFRLHYLANCNALIFTIDPFALSGARAQLRLPSAAIRNFEYDETVDVISRITELLRTELDVKKDQRIGIPIAVVVTKIDAFYSTFDRQGPLIMVPRYASAYDDGDGQLVHEHVSRLLHSWNADEIDIHMRLNYSDFRYFAVSALGEAPDYGNGRLTASHIQPHRVADPVLWLMSKYNSLDKI